MPIQKKGDDIFVFSIKYTLKQEKEIEPHFENLLINKPEQVKGKRINKYILTMNNCTTTTSDALPNTFLGIFLQGPTGRISPIGLFFDLKIMDLFSKDITQLPSIPKKEE
jgi:hypothetical protein